MFGSINGHFARQDSSFAHLMIEILRYLADYCPFLFRPGWFRLTDSLVGESFGGDAMVVLESNVLRARFIRDRAQLLFEFQPLAGKPSEWFSVGLLRGILVGDRGGSEVLDAVWAEFLSESLDELERRFENSDVANA